MTGTSLHGKAALITGACQGVGLHTARKLAAAGANIIGVDRQREPLIEAMNQVCDDFGTQTMAQVADARAEQEVLSAVAAGIDRFGQIDILVNNAGIRKIAPMWETKLELWDEVIEVNLRGQFLFAREVLKQSMLNLDYGKIVFVSSIAGRRGAKSSVAYCASKWGIRGMAAALAQDLKGKPINVTVLTPGRTDTPMARNSEQWNPDIGWLDPEGIANAVLYFVQQDHAVEIPEIHMHHSAEI